MRKSNTVLFKLESTVLIRKLTVAGIYISFNLAYFASFPTVLIGKELNVLSAS